MTEEKKAMAQLLWYKQLFDEGYCEDCNELCSSGASVPSKDLSNSIETVLNLIQKQQEEIEKKDKIIDEMAKYIATLDTDEDICKNVINIGKSFCPEDDCDNLNRDVDCDACIKQYFKTKVEGV